MSRNYIAFISYRHLPREMAVAVRLQKLIERFVIPRDLRRDGEKHLGAVFRDQSELAASSDLSKEICDALDHSQYLIIVCSPETKQSEWCRREVQYFLQKHDAEHVLTVLVKGEWWESLPDELIDLRDAGGEVVEHAEPLSANVVAGSEWECMRKLQKEYLRLIAPILGCPYARLNERMRRYRQSVRLAVGTAALAVVTVFAGVVWKKNQDIAAQYADVQIRESRFLSQLANEALEDNDRLKAINIALAALPSEEKDRPLVSDAERVLTKAVGAYVRDGNSGYAAMKLKMDSTVSDMVMCGEKYLCAVDDRNDICYFDLETGEQKWKQRILNPDDTGELMSLQYDAATDQILVGYRSVAVCLKAEDGSISAQVTFTETMVRSFSFAGDCFYAYEENVDFESAFSLCAYSAAGGAKIAQYDLGQAKCELDGNSYYRSLFTPGRMDIFAEENGERVTIFSIAQLEKNASGGSENSEGSADSSAPYCTAINQIDLNTGEITTFTLAGAFIGGAQVGDCYYAMSMHLDDEEAYKSDQITLTKFVVSEGEGWADFDHVAWQKEIQLEEPADRNSYLYNSDSMNPRYPVIIASNESSGQNGSNESNGQNESNESMIIVGMNTQIMYLNADSGDLIQDYRGKNVLSLASREEYIFAASDDGTIAFCTSSVCMNYLKIGQNIQKFCLTLQNKVVAGLANSSDILVFGWPRDADYSASLQSGKETVEEKEKSRYQGGILSADGSKFLLLHFQSGGNFEGTLYDTASWNAIGSVDLSHRVSKRNSILYITSSGDKVVWKNDDGEVFSTTIGETNKEETSIEETILPAHEYEYARQSALVIAKGENAGSRPILVNFASSHADMGKTCEMKIQYFEDEKLLASTEWSSSCNSLWETPDSFNAGQNGYCVFAWEKDGKRELVVYHVDEESSSIGQPNVTQDETTQSGAAQVSAEESHAELVQVGTYQDEVASNKPTYTCLSSVKPYYATADSDGVLRVMDLSNGEILWTSDAAKQGVGWMQFAKNDTKLFILTNDARLAVMDLETGKVEGFSEVGVPNSPENVQLICGEKDYYLFTTFDGDGCIISGDDLRVKAYVNDMCAYIPGTDQLLVTNYYSGVYAFNVKKEPELRELGIQAISKVPLTQQECLESYIDYDEYMKMFGEWTK